MEGGEDQNPLHEGMENIPNFWVESITPSLTSIDTLLSAQDCNRLPNHPPQPSEFSEFENPNPQDQTAGFVNEYLDPNSGVLVSSDGDKERETDGSSNTWFKGYWRKDEDCELIRLVKQHGDKKWAEIAKEMPGRIGKQCRERWRNHLRPDVKKKLIWTDEEERMMIEAHKKFGNRWAEIAKLIPERSENSIKNHWNATKRRLESKRRIKGPETMDGFVQSTALEEYIKNMRSTTTIAATVPPPSTGINHDGVSYFVVESTNINEEMIMNNNIVAPFTHVDEYSMCCSFTSETTVDEEMSFMKTLFENNNIGNNFSNVGSNGDSGDNVVLMNDAQDCVDFNIEMYFGGSLDSMD